jgi:Transposase IS66 family
MSISWQIVTVEGVGELTRADVAAMQCTTEASSSLQKRINKNRDRLFTFLDCDNVPWNNNNAEHAVRAFTRLRNVMVTSTPKGTTEYCVLLSVQQTLRCRSIGFLHFLRSGRVAISADWMLSEKRCSCRATRQVRGSALVLRRAPRRAHRKTEQASQISALQIQNSKHGLPIWAARRLQAPPPTSASSATDAAVLDPIFDKAR